MAAPFPLNEAPKFVAPMTTPTLGGGGTTTVIFSTTIAAPPATCLETMLDAAGYATWNKWVQKAVVSTASTAPASELPPALAHLASSSPEQKLLPGAEFQFEVHMDPGSASFTKVDLVVTLLTAFERDGRKGLRVAWKTKGDPWYLRAERTQEFLETADGAGAEYYCYETFFGPLAWTIKTFVAAKLQSGLTLWMDGLKAEAEAKAKSSSK